MRTTVLISLVLSSLLTLNLYAQVESETKDRRAELGIEGRIKEISVSPDEKIWLVTAMGNLYYTDGIDSNWHTVPPIFKSTDEYGIGDPHFDRITFFNKDTAILTGYISDRMDKKKSGYYLTKDAGKTWELMDFGGDAWIYDAFTDQHGNVWMGGSSGEIYFSGNGQTWETLNSPYDESTRMHSVFMLDKSTGISGGYHNSIYSTSTNWNTVNRIKTPYDQGKFASPADAAIRKIVIWNNLIVVNQNGHIFYSEHENIDWKPFPVNVYDFRLDTKSQTLYAITDSLDIVVFDSPGEFQFLSDKKLPDKPIDFRVMNGSVYAVSEKYHIYKLNKDGLKIVIPYTTERKIKEPRLIRKGMELAWGTSRNHLYLSENKDPEWYRESAVPFDIADFKLLNDTVAILWDGMKNSYRYSLNDHKLNLYLAHEPLKDFLLSPVSSLTINSGSRGCFHGFSDEINYETINDSVLVTKAYTLKREKGEQLLKFRNQLKTPALTAVLNRINSNYTTLPSYEDFRMTETDKSNFFTLTDEKIKENKPEYFKGKKELFKDFYYSVPLMPDSLLTSAIHKILTEPHVGWSNTSYWFIIQMINQNSDTLNIFNSYTLNVHSWYLPWIFEYKGEYFSCNNIEFSQLINACLPDDFYNKSIFSNSRLIIEVADYLWKK